METPILESTRFIMKALEIENQIELYELARDVRVSKYLMWEPHRSIEDARRYINGNLLGYKAGAIYSWGIYDKASHILIGWIGFVRNEPHQLKCEIGYWLGAPYWNHGVMTEVVACITQFCFEQLRYRRVQARHVKENVASGKVLLKCGFEQEGILKNDLYMKQHLYDTVLYAKTW